VDPVTGEGIYYAMRSGELLAQSLLEGLPELYPGRVRGEFGQALALGARLARTFYYGEFLGGTVPTRLIESGAHSQRFLEVIQDMFEGSPSYLGLAAKLHLALATALWDIGVNRLRQIFRVVPDGLRSREQITIALVADNPPTPGPSPPRGRDEN
jgi:flavin-dependent dehydrogenase